MNSKKCVFRVKEVKFLRFIIFPNSIVIDKSRVKTITD